MTPTTERDFFREISNAQCALNVERHKDGSIFAWELEDVPPSEKELELEKRLHQLEEERARNFDALAAPLLTELKTIISKYPGVEFSLYHCPDIGGLDVIWSNGPQASEIETVLEKYRRRNLFPSAYRYRHCPQCRKEWPELKGRLVCHESAPQQQEPPRSGASPGKRRRKAARRLARERGPAS